MEKLKVVIVDDEERICQLIQALVKWDEMGMQVAGMAHNGIEASYTYDHQSVLLFLHLVKHIYHL